jgi:predicted nuclease of restriction endonuclease-like (RecB) superfamily
MQLNNKYGSGYSVTNLKYFRTFYQVYAERITYPNGHPEGDELAKSGKGHPVGDESAEATFLSPLVREIQSGFSPRLSWSHYRALMRVKDKKAREFYEKEAAESGWDKRDLERQIQSQYYERILSSQNPQALIEAGRRQLKGRGHLIDTLKNPYVLEFLNLPELPVLYESHIESAIISQLQSFLLELGKGFAFVGRQKRLQFEDKDLYIDLVFYNCILKCYLLIDLKTGELTHQDVGQMDGYVRLFDDQYTVEGDNPTIGLILCTEKNEAVAKYSVLSDRKQIFASKYMLYMPSEEVLAAEIMRERRLIENCQENIDGE